MMSLNLRLAEAPFPVVGLTGGIAAGKTYASGRMSAKGWVVINADTVAREVVEPGTEGLAELVAAFGPEVLAPDGALDRAALAKLAFADPALRARLEALTHPRIEAGLAAKLGALPPETVGVVLDAALWVERGQAHVFDALWVVDAPVATRLKRLMERDQLDEAAAMARILAQSAGAEKALHADHVFHNDGRDLDEALLGAEEELLAHWKAIRTRKWRPPMTAPFPPAQLREVLTALLSRGGDYGEIFVEHRRACGLGMDDGRMEDVLAGETFGASLRLMDGETTRFSDLIAPTVEERPRARAAPPSCPPWKCACCPSPAPSSGNRRRCRCRKRSIWCAGPSIWPGTGPSPCSRAPCARWPWVTATAPRTSGSPWPSARAMPGSPPTPRTGASRA